MLGGRWRSALEADGFVVAPGPVDRARCEILRDRAWGLVASGGADDIAGVVSRFEQGSPRTAPPDERISKLFRLHRSEPAFRDAFASSSLTEVLRLVVGPDVDLFLSQVVFKLAGALGEPWHQDAAIFPFDTAGPVMSVWCALTSTTESSSRLGVAPGSHRRGELAHGRDVTHPSGGRYIALVDQAVADAKLLELEVGDAVTIAGNWEADPETRNTQATQRQEGRRQRRRRHTALLRRRSFGNPLGIYCRG